MSVDDGKALDLVWQKGVIANAQPYRMPLVGGLLIRQTVEELDDAFAWGALVAQLHTDSAAEADAPGLLEVAASRLLFGLPVGVAVARG